MRNTEARIVLFRKCSLARNLLVAMSVKCFLCSYSVILAREIFARDDCSVAVARSPNSVDSRGLQNHPPGFVRIPVGVNETSLRCACRSGYGLMVKNWWTIDTSMVDMQGIRERGRMAGCTLPCARA